MSLIVTGLLDPKLTKLGFEDLDDKVSYRLICCTAAGEKVGKTHWAFTAPSPIGAISTDTGTVEVAKKFRKEKKIIVCQFKSAGELQELYGEGKEAKNKAETEWKRLKDSVMELVANKKIRTVVGDTWTEAWELCRLANFGKLTQVMPHHYGPVNSEFRSLSKAVFDREDLNAVYIHKVKKEYKATKKDSEKEVWTGRMERAGFGDMPYIVEVNLRHYFAPAGKDEEGTDVDARFGIEVIDSRHNMIQVVGSKLEAELCNFESLAVSCFPDTAVISDMWR